MKNTDHKLHEALRDKLKDYDSPVPETLWQSVSSQLPKVTQSSTGFGLAKIAALVVGGAIIAGVAIFLSTSNSKEVVSPSEITTNAVAADTLTVGSAENPIDIQQPTSINKSDIVVSASKESTVITRDLEYSEPTPKPIVDDNQMFENNPITEIESAYVDEEPVQSLNDAQQPQPADPRFSIVATDKSGLAFFFIPQHTGASRYSWSFGDGESSDELSPSHRYEEPGEYTVELAIEGASQVFRQTVSALPMPILEAPTIFTPNADGKNDNFDIMALSRHISLETVRVFNATGLPVFESNGNTIWNGDDNLGNPLPEGNYIYTIIAKDLRQQPVEKSGSVYLRR